MFIFLYLILNLSSFSDSRTIKFLQESAPTKLKCTKSTIGEDGKSMGFLQSIVSATDNVQWLQRATDDCALNAAYNTQDCIQILLDCYAKQFDEYQPFVIIKRVQCYEPGCLQMNILVQATGNIYELLLHDEDQENILQTAQWFATHVLPSDMNVPNSQNSLIKTLLYAWPGQMAEQATPWVKTFPFRIPSKFLQNAKLMADRYTLLDSIRADNIFGSALPAQPVVMEIGVASGNYSLHLLHRLEAGVLHLVDYNISPSLYHNVKEYLNDDNSGRIRAYAGDSKVTLSEESNLFRSKSFDLIYIDAGHTYDAVLSDFLNAARLIKRNGIIIFNDYTEFGGDVTGKNVKYGVIEVVHEACTFHGFEMVAITLAPYTFRDVALRRRMQIT